MSYIHLNEVTSHDDQYLNLSCSSSDKLEFFAREDLVLELTCGEYEFNTILKGGSSLQYRKGGIHVLVYGSGEKVSCQPPTHVRYDHGVFRVKYQRYYSDDAVVATMDLFHDYAGGCDIISFQLHSNDGALKGNRSSQLFSVAKNKESPLVKLLKKTHRKGARAVNFTPDGLFLYVPGENPEQQRSTSKKAEALHASVSSLFGSINSVEEVLRRFNISL